MEENKEMKNAKSKLDPKEDEEECGEREREEDEERRERRKVKTKSRRCVHPEKRRVQNCFFLGTERWAGQPPTVSLCSSGVSRNEQRAEPREHRVLLGGRPPSGLARTATQDCPHMARRHRDKLSGSVLSGRALKRRVGKIEE